MPDTCLGISKKILDTKPKRQNTHALRRAVALTGMESRFDERIRGSHHIFTKDGIEEILNLQPKGNKSKPYQVKQVRNVILKYKLGEK